MFGVTGPSLFEPEPCLRFVNLCGYLSSQTCSSKGFMDALILNWFRHEL
jgi:hypothetical protein